MVTLGDLLGSALRAASALPPTLVDEIAAAHLEPEPFVRQAVARFERQASADEWTTLMSRLPGAEDPAVTCLEFMVRWSLALATALPLQQESHDEPTR